jgi:hypothetical protein
VRPKRLLRKPSKYGCTAWRDFDRLADTAAQTPDPLAAVIRPRRQITGLLTTLRAADRRGGARAGHGEPAAQRSECRSREGQDGQCQQAAEIDKTKEEAAETHGSTPAAASTTLKVEASNGLPGFRRADLLCYLASQMASMRFAADSLLEEGGFELPVPLSRKGLSGLSKGDAGPIGWGGGH